jgi:odorant receptor
MSALITHSDFVWFPLKCFKVFGLVPYETYQVSRVKRVFLEIWRLNAFFTLTVPLILMVNFVRDNKDNLALIAESAAPNGYLFIAFIKTIFIFYKKKNFNHILQTLEEIFPKTKDEQKLFNVEVYLKSYKRIEKFVAALIAFASFNFVVVKIGNFILFGIWYDRKLPVENWFPFDKYDPIWYNFVILWTILFSVFFDGGLIGSDMILYSFVTQIVMHFDILSKKLEDLKSDCNGEEVKELTKRHQMLNELSAGLEEIFSFSILFNFTAGSLLICLFGYGILEEVKIELLLKFSAPVIASILQILLICQCGENLTHSEANLSISIYNSEWYNDHKRMKNYLILMSQKSQKPTVITAGKFTVVNFEAFAAVSIKV